MNIDINITKVSYGLTINLGNYQSARFDMEAEVTEGQWASEVLNELKRIVNAEAEKIKSDFKLNPL